MCTLHVSHTQTKFIKSINPQTFPATATNASVCPSLPLTSWGREGAGVVDDGVLQDAHTRVGEVAGQGAAVLPVAGGCDLGLDVLDAVRVIHNGVRRVVLSVAGGVVSASVERELDAEAGTVGAAQGEAVVLAEGAGGVHTCSEDNKGWKVVFGW